MCTNRIKTCLSFILDYVFCHLILSEVMEKYGKMLTVFEQKEILGYSEIWYLGLKAMKIRKYDDEKGHYIMVFVYNTINVKRSTFWVRDHMQPVRCY